MDRGIVSREATYALAASLCRGARVLHLGCGAGEGTRVLAAAGTSAHGVDASSEAVAAAREAAGEGTVTFEVADPLEFARELAPGHFDAIVCLDASEELAAELGRFAREGARVVAVGGASLAEPFVSVAGDGAGDAYVRRIEHANAELQRINTRLARERLGTHDAAAAALIRRLEDRSAEAVKWKTIADNNDIARRAVEKRMSTAPHRAVEALRDMGRGAFRATPLARLKARRRQG